jgi:hypothetical protein
MLPQFILVTGLWIAPARDVRQSCPRKMITNPPFRLSERFVIRALEVARARITILARTVFIKSVGRPATCCRGIGINLVQQGRPA